MRRTLVALVLTVAIATPLAAQSSPDFGGVRRILREGMAREAAPAAAFAVVRDGVIIWEEAIGWADSVNNRPATPDSPFLLASLNKTFETTLAAVLQGRHRVDLDHPVNEYLRTPPPALSSPVAAIHPVGRSSVTPTGASSAPTKYKKECGPPTSPPVDVR